MSLKQGSWNSLTSLLPISQIDKDYANRKTMSNLDKLEADMIRAGGLYYPIIVSPYIKDGDNFIVGEEAVNIWDTNNVEFESRRYMICDGERRFVVANRLGWTKIPCFVRLKDSLIELHELQLASNAKREPINALDTAKAIERYIKEYMAATGFGIGIALKRVATLTDFSRTYIDGRLDILKMPDSIQQDVQKGVTRANLATEILNNIPIPYQPLVIERAAKHQMVNVLETRIVGKQLDLITDMTIEEDQKQAMAESVIARGGRFAYNMDKNSDLPAYEFEARAFFKRVSCWNISGASVKQLETIAGILNDTLTLFRNMQKEELEITRIGELKEKQWYRAKQWK